MSGDRTPKVLNVGCGFNKMEGAINIDAYDICVPDIVHDLNVAPWPFEDNSIDIVYANHVMEHLNDWWTAFCEVGRILKPLGKFEMRVPDESSSSALGYRDHHFVFSRFSFHGASLNYRAATNAWAATVENSIPLALIEYYQVPFKKYNWLVRFPSVLGFLAEHMRNFIFEQKFVFIKLPEGRQKNAG